MVWAHGCMYICCMDWGENGVHGWMDNGRTTVVHFIIENGGMGGRGGGQELNERKRTTDDVRHPTARFGNVSHHRRNICVTSCWFRR